jgi:uncharacterized membrane protein YfcA
MSTLSTRQNPYASPSSSQQLTQTEAGPKLFSELHIAIATFLASSLAGMTLAAINHYRLGNKIAAAVSLLIGAAIVAVVVGLSMLIPLPGLLFALAQAGIALAIAKAQFGKQYEANQANDVPNANGWVVLGVTAAWTVVLVVAFLALSTILF